MNDKNSLAVINSNTSVSAISDNRDNSESMLMSPDVFDHFLSVSKYLSKASLLPDHFSGEENIGNLLIALNYSHRIHADPFMVMQNMYVVGGRPGIEAKLAIALLNQSGVYSPLRFKYSKDKDECYAFATNTRTKELLKGITVSIKMAKDEGWFGKKFSKWRTMPEMMLMYRSAMFWIRQYEPGVMLGMSSREELIDTVADGIDPTEPTDGIEPVEVEVISETFDANDDQKSIKRFNDLTKDFHEETLNIFVSETAKTLGIEPKAVKIGASLNIRKFITSLIKWQKKQYDIIPDKVKKSKEFEDMIITEDMVPDAFNAGLLKYGVPLTTSICAAIGKYVNESIDSASSTQ